MLPQSILSEIMNYLSLPELLTTAVVNKRFLSASNLQRVYRREFLRIWMSSPDTLEQASTSWKSLCLRGIRSKKYWQNLSACDFTIFDIRVLYDEVIESLACPPPVFPVLRRDIFSFPTLMQDLLANPQDQYLGDFDSQVYAEEIERHLKTYSEELYQETSNTDLVRIRWCAGKKCGRDSVGSMCTQASYEDIPGKSYLIQLFTGVKKCVKAHCAAVSELIIENQEVLGAYSNYWESFTYAISKINSLFLPVTEMINEFYEIRFQGKDACPRVNFYKVMADIWRKSVFERCKEKLLAAVIQEISSLRKNQVEYWYSIESKRLAEGLLDISLNELNIFFKSHSMLALEGPYQFLHLGLVDYLKEFYQTTPVDFASEENLLASIFPAVTVREARRVYCAVLGTANSNSLLLQESQNFDKTEDDLMTEWRASNLGIPISQSSEDLWKYSQCRESKLIDIFNYLSGYSEKTCEYQSDWCM